VDKGLENESEDGSGNEEGSEEEVEDDEDEEDSEDEEEEDGDSSDEDDVEVDDSEEEEEDADSEEEGVGNKRKGKGKGKGKGKLSKKELAQEAAKQKKRELQQKAKKAAAKQASASSADVDYGVSRGIDFQGVNFVVNFDFPVSAAAYTHRVGRTGRGGAAGTSLSFVATVPPAGGGAGAVTAAEVDIAMRDQEVLQTVREQQPRLGAAGTSGNVLGAIGAGSAAEDAGLQQPQEEEERRMQPAPLEFNAKELESFRYRVEDTLRSVTVTAVRELRSAELKREILNSERLKSFFAENPNDLKVRALFLSLLIYIYIYIYVCICKCVLYTKLISVSSIHGLQVLRHDKAIAHPIRQKDHLKTVPDYLMPVSMRSVSNVRNNRRNKKRRTTTSSSAASSAQRVQQSKKRNPLYNLDASGASESAEGGAGAEDHGGDGGDGGDDQQADSQAHKQGMYDGDGEAAMSGRKQWKLRHKKGSFNPKAAKKNENRTPGTFVTNRKFNKK
jgi:ATP-dependent RNA helicase DDX56/DBP9